jgi:hypothetical protein
MPPWIADAQPAAHGWFHSQWFGSFYHAKDRWMYHADFGWLYAVGDGSGGVWLWDSEFGWLWTRREHFPHLYHHRSSGWLYFIRKVGSQRAFYNYATQRVEIR